MLIICSILLCNNDNYKSGKSGHTSSSHNQAINRAINQATVVVTDNMAMDETDDIAAELVLALDKISIVDSLTAEEYRSIVR